MYEIIEVYEVVEKTNEQYMKFIGYRSAPIEYFLNCNEAKRCANMPAQTSGYIRDIETRDAIRIKETGEVFLLGQREPLFRNPPKRKKDAG